ncbi:MAG: DUF736 domain-containing protein [Alphaproteobacteria bacterium]
MSKIGYLKSVSDGNPQELYGEIKTLQLQLQINLVPIHQKTKASAPDYTIYAHGEIEIGSAWIKTKQKLGQSQLEFLSITVDDPSMPNALNVAAWKMDNGLYEITWRRRQSGQNQNEAA